MTNNDAAKTALLWIGLLAFFTYRAATTGALQQVSTYVGLVAGIALLAAAWAVGRRRSKKSAL